MSDVARPTAAPTTTRSADPASAHAPARSLAALREAGRLRADVRLPAYLVGGFGALVAAIATGQAGLAALAAPFIALAAMGVVDRASTAIAGTVTLNTEDAIEGDIVEGVVALDWDGVAELDVILAGARGVQPVDPAPVVGWSIPAGRGPVTLPFRLRALAWGAHEAGAVWVRARRPGSLLFRERKLPSVPQLRVLPTPLRLDNMLRPAEPRAIAGMHTSRFRGHGTDFAELRPYRPGDRIRDLAWGTSARFDEPWVTVHHSERTGTLLLLLDTVFSRHPRGTEALARAARAAWALAAVHLRAQDRVGLLARGRTVAWLPPRGGRRARIQLLDALLATGAAAEDPWLRPRAAGRVIVPGDALIVGVTGLESSDFVPALLRFRRTGHRAVALVIDTADMVAESAGTVDDAARRLWIARRDAGCHDLERNGVPTALVTAAEGVGPAISALRRRTGAIRGRPGAAAR